MSLNLLFQTWLRGFRPRVCLDAAAGLPESHESRGARRAAERFWGNPSSPHGEGREAKVALDAARLSVARTLGVREGEVIFCSGGTEAANLGVLGTARALLAEGPVTIAVAASSHPSVARAAEAASDFGAAVVTLPVDDRGRIAPQVAAAAVAPTGATLVCVPRVAGETGAVSSTRAIREAIDAAALAQSRRAVLFVDAAQSAIFEDVSPSRLAADLVSLDGAKIGGPKGSGCLVARVDVLPVQVGGRQEGGRRAGTENVPAAAGFAAALAEAKRSAPRFAAETERSVAALWAEISAAVPGARRNIAAKDSAPHFLSVHLPDCDGAYACAVLDELGVSASPSAACRAAANESLAAGYPDPAAATSSVRLTLPPRTSPRIARRVVLAFARAASLSKRAN